MLGNSSSGKIQTNPMKNGKPEEQMLQARGKDSPSGRAWKCLVSLGSGCQSTLTWRGQSPEWHTGCMSVWQE